MAIGWLFKGWTWFSVRSLSVPHILHVCMISSFAVSCGQFYKYVEQAELWAALSCWSFSCNLPGEKTEIKINKDLLCSGGKLSVEIMKMILQETVKLFSAAVDNVLKFIVDEKTLVELTFNKSAFDQCTLLSPQPMLLAFRRIAHFSICLEKESGALSLCRWIPLWRMWSWFHKLVALDAMLYFRKL